MLYMIVSTHNPDTCPIVNPTSMQKMVSANQRMADVTKALGVTVQGSWTDMPAHTIFMLIDAPKPEVLQQTAREKVQREFKFEDTLAETQRLYLRLLGEENHDTA